MESFFQFRFGRFATWRRGPLVMTDNRYNIIPSANLHSNAVGVRRLALKKKPAPIDHK